MITATIRGIPLVNIMESGVLPQIKNVLAEAFHKQNPKTRNPLRTHIYEGGEIMTGLAIACFTSTLVMFLHGQFESAFGLFCCGLCSLVMHRSLYPWKFVYAVRELDESLQTVRSKEAFGGLTELPHTETEMLPFLRNRLLELVWLIRFYERNRPESPDLAKWRNSREKFLKACSKFGYDLGDQNYFFDKANSLLDQGLRLEDISLRA